MSTLHRAIVSSRLHEAEISVFFEVPFGTLPADRLVPLITTAWGVSESDLDICNICSEHELIDAKTLRDPFVSDLQLFENGHGPDGASYCDPVRTQFLVCPSALRRLVSAQARIPLPPTHVSSRVRLAARQSRTLKKAKA